MAISRERLIKLIKQGATIYDIFKGDIYLVDLTMAKYYDVPEYIEYKNDYYNCNLTRSINDLFETKEEAEWYFKFGNITRTETLSLPTWDEFCIMEDDFVFTNNGSTYLLRNDVDKIKIIEHYYDNIYYAFNKPLYKENYIEACNVAKSLFLGENSTKRGSKKTKKRNI